MDALMKLNYERILEVIQECEEIQTSGESGYTKEQSKLSAYEEIKDILGIGW